LFFEAFVLALAKDAALGIRQGAKPDSLNQFATVHAEVRGPHDVFAPVFGAELLKPLHLRLGAVGVIGHDRRRPLIATCCDGQNA